MQFRRSSSAPVAINIAPLVDVVFLLVIFFAVSTTFLETAGLELTLPTSSSTAERAPKEITVEVSKDESVYLEGERVEEGTLATRLQEQLEERDDKLVLLRADEQTPHGTVVRIMDLARAAGATGLTIAARRDGD
ncbi:MAG: biopolymer transporter ExbD [Acidobacteria bacterium]|nr:biopolymer transporter ExbD [Acidobacteriota bacterium]NIM63091.1 biopolymer transporter ExbD [Acidobacteriota bacterium]NIO60802.1 biopolymer transporter ExbD [Acidobacteriota bacterium]NIQ31874.1 biopolymer transporter ExbD [Acidobacteriota bacterium]NIQ87251.1 biopolymer transporter ExbD [Acidobacteriota bacterium]